jgi:hypothetical protein
MSKPIFGPKNELAVLEHPHRVHLGRTLRQRLQDCAEASQAVAYGEVVLDVLGRVDHGHWGRFARFDGLEQRDNLRLGIGGHGGSFGRVAVRR